MFTGREKETEVTFFIQFLQCCETNIQKLEEIMFWHFYLSCVEAKLFSLFWNNLILFMWLAWNSGGEPGPVIPTCSNM